MPSFHQRRNHLGIGTVWRCKNRHLSACVLQANAEVCRLGFEHQ